MKKGDIYIYKSSSRTQDNVYIRIIEVFKPGTSEYNREKERLGSDGKELKSIFIKYERCNNPKFDFCYTNYMKRTDFLYHFKKYIII